MYELKFIKEYEKYNLFEKYKDGKYLYRVCIDKFQAKENKKEGDKDVK